MSHDPDGEFVEEKSALARTDAMGIEVRQEHETAAIAIGQKLATIVQAKYALALKYPRDLDACRIAILADCKRPKFAAAARFKKPQGKKQNPETKKWEDTFIEGPSIRFAEAAARAFKNIEPSVTILYDDADKRISRCEVTDYESNLTWSKEITIQKLVVRRELKFTWEGWGERRQKVVVPPLFQRANSAGQPVYIYAATDDEVTMKASAMESKVLRTLIIRMLPSDILDEAMEACVATVEKGVKQDPDAERKALLDAFAAMRVMPDALAEYLAKPVADLSPAELVELRGIYQALKDGEVKWGDLIEMKRAPEGEDPKDSPQAKKAAETKAKVLASVDKVTKRAQKPAPKQAPKSPDEEEPPADWKPAE